MRGLAFLFICFSFSTSARADDTASLIAARLQQALAGSPYTVTLACDKGPDCSIVIE